MKVAVTYTIDDNQRLIIGAITTGKLQRATREQIQEYMTNVVNRTLASAVGRLEKYQAVLVEQVMAEAEAIVAEADNADK